MQTLQSHWFEVRNFNFFQASPASVCLQRFDFPHREYLYFDIASRALNCQAGCILLLVFLRFIAQLLFNLHLFMFIYCCHSQLDPSAFVFGVPVFAARPPRPVANAAEIARMGRTAALKSSTNIGASSTEFDYIFKRERQRIAKKRFAAVRVSRQAPVAIC